MSGVFEILIVLAIVVLIFGASKLPAVGSTLGKMVGNFKNARHTKDEIEVTPKKLDR